VILYQQQRQQQDYCQGLQPQAAANGPTRAGSDSAGRGMRSFDGTDSCDWPPYSQAEQAAKGGHIAS